MAEGASRERWNHTASLMALLANCHRNPKHSRLLKPTDFHPHPHAPTPISRPKAEITVLKQVFVERRT